MTETPTETLIIRRRFFERLDHFVFRVALWQAMGDQVEWLPAWLPFRATSAARLTRADRPLDLSYDPITTSEPLRILVRHFVREALGQLPLDQAGEHIGQDGQRHAIEGGS
jgi:hypothetical protein